MSRTPEAQLTTARMLLAQFIVQLEELEPELREREHRAKNDFSFMAERNARQIEALQERISALREGRATWEKRVAELEAEVRA